jgi:signal transduction histidine kinase
MGLATVRRLVEGAGGHVSATSVPRKGTEVVIELSVAPH